MLEVIATAAFIVSAGAAAFAAIGIWRGLIAMVNANKDRGKSMDKVVRTMQESLESMMKADERRHIEAMAAFADQRQEAEAQRRALIVLVEHTAATPPRSAPPAPPSHSAP